MTIQKFDPRARKVKILATIGPASRDPDMLRRLFKAGADAFRVNMSHGEHSVHGETIRAIRALEKEFARPIAILADLQGPKHRVGPVEDGVVLDRRCGHDGIGDTQSRPTGPQEPLDGEVVGFGSTRGEDDRRGPRAQIVSDGFPSLFHDPASGTTGRMQGRWITSSG